MAFLSGSILQTALKATLGRQFNEKHIKQVAYELSLGYEAFRTDSKDGKIEILGESNKTVEINPGQFALLLTRETVNIPKHLLAFISIKAGEKLKGLVNVSGFHVDPGFRGQLLFSVYNAGPSTITMRKDEQYFLLWLSELTGQLAQGKEYNEKDNHHQNQSGIATKYVDALKRGDLASPNVLLDKIKELEHIKSRNQWLLTFLIVMFAGIAVKVFWDWDEYHKGVAYGLNQRSIREEVREAIAPYSLDSVFSDKLDSLLRKKYKLVSDSATTN